MIMKKAILVPEDSTAIRGSGFGAFDEVYEVYGYPVYHNTCRL